MLSRRAVLAVCFFAPWLGLQFAEAAVNISLVSATCYEPFKVQEAIDVNWDTLQGVRCAGECGYVSPCLSPFSAQCVRHGECNQFNDGAWERDASLMQGHCRRCAIRGCADCQDGQTCSACLPDFVLQNDGTCLWSGWYASAFMIGITAVLIVWVIADFYVQHRKPTTNWLAIEHGLINRSEAIIRNRSVEGYPQYPITTSMHSTDEVGGPGMPLFLNWFCLVLACALWLLLMSLIFLQCAQDTEEICFVPANNGTQGSLDFTFQEKDYAGIHVLAWTFLNYIGVVLLSASFCAFQRKLWVKLQDDEESSPLPHHWAVEASGFPPDALDYSELLAYWRVNLTALGMPPDGVVHLSIAYDYRKHVDKIIYLTDQLVRLEDVRLGYKQDFENKIGIDGKKVANSDMDEYDPGTFWVQAISWLMLGTDLKKWCCNLRGWSRPAQPVDAACARKLLEEIKGSGTVIVVFHKKVAAFETYSAARMPIKFRDIHPISCSKFEENPETVQWQNYGIPCASHCMRFTLFFVVMPIAVVVWALLYLPFVRFTITSQGAGLVSSLVGQVFGGVIGVGNCVVSFAVSFLVANYGFTHKGRELMWYHILIVPCVLGSVVADIAVTMYVTLLEENRKYGDLIWDFDFQINYSIRIVRQTLFDLLVPAYIIIPYILEPALTVLLPYWLAIWRTKRDRSIGCEYAERIMVASVFDAISSPYCDLIVTTSVFMLAFLHPGSRIAWKFCLGLICFVSFLYLLQRIRGLRWQTAAFFSTDYNHKIQMFFWALPLGILAASVGVHIDNIELVNQFGVKLWVAGAFFFLGHILLHWSFVMFVVPLIATPKPWKEHGDYIPSCRLCTSSYRNTNPVEVLKSRLPEYPYDPLVFWQVGKEYLQPGAMRCRFEKPNTTCCSACAAGVKEICYNMWNRDDAQLVVGVSCPCGNVVASCHLRDSEIELSELSEERPLLQT